MLKSLLLPPSNLRSVCRTKTRFLAPILFGLLSAATCAYGQTSPSFQSVQIGAFDPAAWNGIVFLTQAFNQRADFALRIGSQSGSGFVDGAAIYNNVAEVGPRAPDGSYCRMSWRNLPRQALISLEWSRIDRNTVVGKLTAPVGFRLVIETYFPGGQSWGSEGDYRVDEEKHLITGEHFFDRIFGKTARFLVMADRPPLASGAFASLSHLRNSMLGSGRLSSDVTLRTSSAGAAGMEFDTSQTHTIHFVAELGWNENELETRARPLLEEGNIDSILAQKARAYADHRPAISGLFQGAATAIGNSMFWNTLYAPSTGLIFPSISRKWASGWGGWVVGEWDCFFGSLLTSLEDKAQTDAAIKAILLAQTPTGLVPNIASGGGITPDRSQPPVGSYCALKDYERFHDLQMLTWAYPRLKKWHVWWFANRGDGQPWRDGNRDGLLEWGSDRGSAFSIGGRGFLQAAKWESGMDDSPMYDHAAYDAHTYTMNLDDVGLNSLYALDSECMAKIAGILGKKADEARFVADYARIKKLVQQRLWNEHDGIFENRYWDGKFSKRLSPTNFYPLFAGIATQKQADRMVKEHLLNPKEFWGKYVIPTVARDDLAFQDQFYWRGDIWGPTNYMVYEGLNRYHFDRIALEFAEKSYALFMSDWKRNRHDDEQYHAWGGNGGGDTHYTWGALLCLAGVEQYIDENPWEGLRFGALDPPSKGELRRARWANDVYDVVIGPKQTELSRDGKLCFQADAGVVVRDYEKNVENLSFSVDAEQPTHVTTREFSSGRLRLSLDGKAVGDVRVRDQSATFAIPAGDHSINLARE